MIRLFLLAIGLIGCAGQAWHPSTSATLVDSLQIAELIKARKGSVVLVTVWATWCPPCVAEMPFLRDLEKRLAQSDFVWIPIAADAPEFRDEVSKFFQKQEIDKIPYLKTGADQTFIDTFSPKWTGALPAAFIYDRNGAQVDFWEGELPLSEIEKRVLRCMKP